MGKSDLKKVGASGRLEAEFPEKLYKMNNNDTINDMLSHIPVGICKVRIDKDLRLLHGNPDFYTLYGYDQAQMERELGGKIIRTIFPDDLSMVRKQLKEALKEGKIFETEHRIIRRDGSNAWVFVRGSFAKEHGQDVIFCVAIDVSGRKKIEQELRINEERFRIALAQMDNTIFDYDIATKVMIHAYKSASMYGFDNRVENVPDSLVEQEVIHQDSVAVFLEMYRKIRQGQQSASCEVRTRLVEGRYLWRRITMTNIYDNDGNAVRAIGMLEDIEEQKKREEKLRDQSERDPLTGLYNRRATEKYTKKTLKEAGTGCKGAMYVIDIDEFKSVNDKYGHMFGDNVLMETAKRISTIFNDGEIIGRIGGDEFIVFVNELDHQELMFGYAQALCVAFRSDFEFNGIITKVSCSVGIAAFPENGNTFDELYQKADIALYEAKRAGKSRACIYDSSMGSGMEWSFSREAENDT